MVTSLSLFAARTIAPGPELLVMELDHEQSVPIDAASEQDGVSAPGFDPRNPHNTILFEVALWSGGLILSSQVFSNSIRPFYLDRCSMLLIDWARRTGLTRFPGGHYTIWLSIW